MSSRGTVFFTALIILSVITYLCLSTGREELIPQPIEKKSISSAQKKIGLASRYTGMRQETENQKLPEVILEAQKAISRSREKRAELALQDTPEKHQAAVQGMLEHRKPHFDSLFDAWGLSPDTQSSVYEIIRGRLDERRRDSVNRSTSYAIGSRERKSNRDEIDLRSLRNLSKILGEERSIELMKLDKSLEDEFRQKLLQSAKGMNP